MKNRILISNILVLLILILSKPDSLLFFYIGLPFIMLGQAIRFISSGTLTKSKMLTTNGIYAIVRNPLYLGTLIITFGLLIQLSSKNKISENIFMWIFISISFALIYYKTIKSEENFLKEKFGQEFEKYLSSTPALLINLKDFSKLKGLINKDNYSKELFLKNKEYRGLSALIIIEIIILFKIKYAL
jgi:protein-S-isoprenylcysteine O-methyltransferase Ste14